MEITNSPIENLSVEVIRMITLSTDHCTDYLNLLMAHSMFSTSISFLDAERKKVQFTIERKKWMYDDQSPVPASYELISVLPNGWKHGICKKYKRNWALVTDPLFGGRDVVWCEGHSMLLAKEATWQNNLKHGQYTTLWDKGHIRTQGVFVQGKKHGLWTHYSRISPPCIFSQQEYENGVELNFKSWYLEPVGALRKAIVRNFDSSQTITEWWRNGQTKCQHTIRDKEQCQSNPDRTATRMCECITCECTPERYAEKYQPHGQWKNWDQNGKMTRFEVYDEGVMVAKYL